MGLRENVKAILGEQLSKKVGNALAPILAMFNIVKGYVINSSSQYGEDRIIDKLLGYKARGYYVDIGANDPNLMNNTRRFYNKGWSGINCEPNYELFKKITRYRKRDINLNAGVGSGKGELTFYEMSANTLSTFNKASADYYVKEGYRIIRTIKVPIITLGEIFDKLGNPVDFLSLDVEGYEMEVLESNDWQKNRPTLMLVETNQDSGTISDYLNNINYRLVWKNHTNSIYCDNDKFDCLRSVK
jgi:FkbM family methyltransferase